MSTKIYNGFRCDILHFEDALTWLRTELFSGYTERFAPATMGELRRERENIGGCGVHFWPHKGSVYMVAYGPKDARARVSKESLPSYLEDFSYWNNTEGPEDVSEQEWHNRQEVWGHLLQGNGWEYRSTIRVINEDGWTDNLLRPFVDKDAPPKPRDPVQESTLDPGITRTVGWLQGLGFHTTDSGDGVSKPKNERVFDFPHVVIVVDNPEHLISESKRIQFFLELRGIFVEPQTEDGLGVSIEAAYDLGARVGTILLSGVSDAILNLPTPESEERVRKALTMKEPNVT